MMRWGWIAIPMLAAMAAATSAPTIVLPLDQDKWMPVFESGMMKAYWSYFEANTGGKYYGTKTTHNGASEAWLKEKCASMTSCMAYEVTGTAPPSGLLYYNDGKGSLLPTGSSVMTRAAGNDTLTFTFEHPLAGTFPTPVQAGWNGQGIVSQNYTRTGLAWFVVVLDPATVPVFDYPLVNPPFQPTVQFRLRAYVTLGLMSTLYLGLILFFILYKKTH